MEVIGIKGDSILLIGLWILAFIVAMVLENFIKVPVEILIIPFAFVGFILISVYNDQKKNPQEQDNVLKKTAIAWGAVLVVVFFIILICNVWYNNEHPWVPDTNKQEKIISELKPLINDAQISSTGAFIIRKKVLIWNLDENSQNKAYYEIPAERQALSSDAAFTVLIITDFKAKIVGSYSNGIPVSNGYPVYRRAMNISLINWPEKQLLGKYHMEYLDPETISVRYGGRLPAPPIADDSKIQIKQWILSLRVES